MKISIIIVVILTTHTLCLGQFNWDLTHKLSEEANRVYPNSFRNCIDLDSLNKEIFETGKMQIGIDTLSNWKFLFECAYHSTYSIGDPPLVLDFLIPDSLRLPPKKNMKCMYDSSKIYYGGELFRDFVKDTALLKSNVSIGEIYIFSNRAIFNGVVVPLLSDDYLLLRYTSNYHGDVTSHHNEITLYFKRKR